jgi:carbonic anhydrase/acetyltransferase-like protein (isoleucine patch superfamily)
VTTTSPDPFRRLAAKIVDVRCGTNVTIVEPSNVYGCTLGDDVFVGPFVEIQKQVTALSAMV